MLDGDEAGRSAAVEIAQRLVKRLYVRIIDLADGKQPDQLTSEEIQALLTTVF
jgi:DNA primase